jgi:hypothetical protein
VNVKLYEAPGANGPELNAPPVAVHVCVVGASLFVTVTVDPTGTDTALGWNANPEMLIAAWTGGTVVVVGGGGGGWVVVVGGGGGGWVVCDNCWVAAPGEATLEGPGTPDEGGAVVVEAPGEPGAVGVAPDFAAPPALSVVVVTGPFPVGLVVVGPPRAGCERLACDVVVERFPLLNDAGAPLQAAALSVTSASPTSKSEARVR